MSFRNYHPLINFARLLSYNLCYLICLFLILTVFLIPILLPILLFIPFLINFTSSLADHSASFFTHSRWNCGFLLGLVLYIQLVMGAFLVTYFASYPSLSFNSDLLLCFLHLIGAFFVFLIVCSYFNDYLCVDLNAWNLFTIIFYIHLGILILSVVCFVYVFLWIQLSYLVAFWLSNWIPTVLACEDCPIVSRRGSFTVVHLETLPTLPRHDVFTFPYPYPSPLLFPPEQEFFLRRRYLPFITNFNMANVNNYDYFYNIWVPSWNSLFVTYDIYHYNIFITNLNYLNGLFNSSVEFQLFVYFRESRYPFPPLPAPMDVFPFV